MAIASLTGTLSSVASSGTVVLRGDFNVSLSGFGVASVNLERSFDDGTTWKVVDTFSANDERSGFEPEGGILYRFNCTAYTSGTISYRLSK